MAQMTEETALLMLSYFLPMKPKARKALEFIRAKLKESQPTAPNSAITPPEHRDCDTCANDGECYVTMLYCKGYARAAQ